MDRKAARKLLVDLYRVGVAAVDPERAVAAALDPEERYSVVFALGKAAPAMVRGAVRTLGLDRLDGIAISNHHAAVPPGIELRIGGHPVPTQESIEAGERMLARAAELGAGDRALVLISGGGSALAEAPVAGLSLHDLAITNEALLRSGAAIGHVNLVRRHLSRFKGGGLGRAISPAAMETLVISDVVGDSLATIASGPTVASGEGPTAALDTVNSLGIADSLPDAVRRVLGESAASPTPIENQSIRIIASGPVAAHAVAAAAERRGFPASVVDTRLTGEASEAAGEVLERRRGTLSVFAGETTVHVRGDGCGGRNQEAALVAATLIEGRPDLFFLAAGTDGVDGMSDAAGAVVDGTTLHRARARGLDASAALDRNDSGTFFSELGDQIVTGPTGTNVGDLWLVLQVS